VPHSISTELNRPLQILIVEDNEDDRDLLTLYLRHHEFACDLEFVDTAAGMSAALALRRWDVVISDHRLPHFSSAAALAMVKALEPSPPFILVSGFIGETAAVEALHQGATDFVMKDNFARLGPAIRRALRNAATSEAARASQHALRDSESRFRSLTEIAPVGIFLTDAAQCCVWINERGLEISGFARDEVLGRDWREVFQVTSPAPLDALPGPTAESSRPVQFEASIERPDRQTRWVIGQLISQASEQSRLTGQVGVVTDITARKRAELDLVQSEQRLRDLSSHIVQIEEQLRADVAREIHDDIGSSLTGMKIDLALLRKKMDASPEVSERLQDLDRLIDAAAISSRRIIRALRPTVLDHGIVPALQWQLEEFERRHGVRVHFEHPKSEPVLDETEAVALFRIVQEALTNIAKHAHASEVTVTLFIKGRQLTLEIADNGVGLVNGRAERSGSYGIIGMRERIQSLNGWMEIEGPPGRGVTLMLAIPYRTAKTLRQA
jgi:two-component system sensor histidine kinase UhpB